MLCAVDGEHDHKFNLETFTCVEEALSNASSTCGRQGTEPLHQQTYPTEAPRDARLSASKGWSYSATSQRRRGVRFQVQAARPMGGGCSSEVTFFM